MMYPQILILSGLYDFSTDEICLELQRRNVEFIRINIENLADLQIKLIPQKQTLYIKYEDTEWELTPENLKSVYFRQPVFLRNTPAIPLTKEQQLSKSQWMAFLRGLMLFDNLKWINHPQATYLAESKPYQLYIADKLGFETPKTIITNAYNDEICAEEFIIKSIDTVYLKEDGFNYFAYSNIVNKKNLKEYSLHEAPFMLQELVKNKIDIRVTLIGESVFAHKVMSNNEIKGDWRKIPKEDLKYISYILSDEIKQKCIDLNKVLKLTYSAIDFVLQENKLIFLEVNPTGEWGFLNYDGDLNLEKIICNILLD